jgi:hypothetical protein
MESKKKIQYSIFIVTLAIPGFLIFSNFFGRVLAAPAANFQLQINSAAPFCGDGVCNGTEACGTCPADCGSCGGGGGGGGYFVPSVASNITYSGRGYAGSKITLLKDGQVVGTAVADSNGNFSITVSGLSGGSYIFSLYDEDKNGFRSPLLALPITIGSNATIQVANLLIAPTAVTDKIEVKQGETIIISGQSQPNADITIVINSDKEISGHTASDAKGVYSYAFNSAQLEMGQHSAKSKATVAGVTSPFSQLASFIVGTKTVLAPLGGGGKCGKADLNCDGRVNLVDFSIAAYWYKKPLSDAFKSIEAERLNGDGKIDLADFSIMAYYWTG